MDKQEPNPKEYVTNEVLDAKFKAVVAQMTTRTVIIVAVGAGVSQASLPTSVTVGAFITALVYPLAKGLAAIIGAR